MWASESMIQETFCLSSLLTDIWRLSQSLKALERIKESSSSLKELMVNTISSILLGMWVVTSEFLSKSEEKMQIRILSQAIQLILKFSLSLDLFHTIFWYSQEVDGLYKFKEVQKASKEVSWGNLLLRTHQYAKSMKMGSYLENILEKQHLCFKWIIITMAKSSNWLQSQSKFELNSLHQLTFLWWMIEVFSYHQSQD